LKKISATCILLSVLIFLSVQNRSIDFEVKASETLIQKVKIENCIGKLNTYNQPSIFNQISELTGQDIKSMKIQSIYTPKVEVKKNYTDDDVFCLAVAIYREHGSNTCSNRQRILDGNVIMNRVRSGDFANTIRGVLTSKGAYDGFQHGVKFPKSAKADCEKEAVKRAYECAKRVLDGEKLCPDDVIYQSEYSSLGVVWEKIGNTYYSRRG